VLGDDDGEGLGFRPKLVEVKKRGGMMIERRGGGKEWAGHGVRD
jgi:hypothetical protein